MNMPHGNFVAYDDTQKPVLLEWQKVQGQTDELNRKIKSLVNILVPSYTKTELLFAQKKPELVSADFILKYLVPFFEKNKKVDWLLIEQKVHEHLVQFFDNFDWKGSSNIQDENIFVTAKDPNTKENIGTIQFIKTPEYGGTTVKAALYGVMPAEQHRGIERLLMAAIFRIQPHLQRIFLHTRSTNTHLVDMYKSWGFTEFVGQLPGWTDLEYLAEQSTILQKH